MTSKVYSIPTNKKIISVVDDEMDISELSVMLYAKIWTV